MQYFDNNPSLKSELRTLSYQYDQYRFTFNSDLGVFSKDKIDEGSKLLAETYFKYGKKNLKVLDVGCGIGFLGITINKIMESDVTMVDINKRCIHLTEMNIKSNQGNAKVLLIDIYSNVDEKFDVIITNPPIRAGKSVYLKIINDAFLYADELWFVMRTNHGVKTVIKLLKEKYNVEVLNKDKGFYIVKCFK